MRNKWIKAWAVKKFRIAFSIALAAIIGIAFFMPWYFHWLQCRKGMVLDDPILKLFAPIDISNFIFFILFGTIISGFLLLIRNPYALLYGMFTYVIMMTIRNVCLYLVALDPPASIVELYDPLINKIFYRGEQITRDLFFSGHTATLLVFGLSLVPRNHKKIFISLAAVMGISVLVQHIHYSIDVGAAFLFTYISAVITRNIFNKTGLKNLKTM